ncbi:HEAT repeat-containing protein 3 [Eumeta japonica]|uniref:HEAT repeat-containing protein 3 n=1 Tax=Eumeta variegata TaxID=151549 RepID=A0A4C1YG04_EUMVA|nr:HEAT repeat-containing protein 3 [Eumeta japonica]
MGKVRKTKTKRNKSNAENENNGQVIVDSKENAIQTILDQLQAPNVEEKCCALQTMALLAESSENVQEIISNDVVRAAAPFLVDSAGSVRNIAAGALRNLSTMGYETCDALIEQDIMTPLICYFHQYTETWTLNDKSKSKDEDAETFVQCINLLLNLCESSELAVKSLCESRILDILPKYLDLSSISHNIIASVLHCLFVVVEDNPGAIEKIKANGETQLQSLLNMEGSDYSTLLLKTLSAGIVINMTHGQIHKLPPEVISKIMVILSNALTVDHRQACHQLSSNIPLRSEDGKTELPKGKEAQTLNDHLNSVSHLLDSQQSAIEIIANLCSCGDDDELIDSEDSSDTEDMGVDEICNGSDNTESLLVEDKLPSDVLEAVISLDMFNKVWAKAQLPAENVMLHNLQTRALLCVNNMLSILPLKSLSDVDGVYKIWVDAGKLAFKQNTDNILLESATAVMRAALDRIKFRENKTNDGTLFSNLALSDIEVQNKVLL